MFFNQPVDKLLKQYNFRYFVTNNELEASLADCFNRMLETKVWGCFTARSYHSLHQYVTGVYDKEL